MNGVLGSLSKPYRRALALTILLMLLFIIYSIVFEPWLSASLSHSETAAQQSELLQARQSMADRIPALEARLAALKKDPQSGRRLLVGANAGLAATGLQASLRNVLGASKAEIISVEGLPSDPAAQKSKGPMRVVARVVFRGSEPVLRDALTGVETAVPYLYVQRLAVNATGGKITDLKSATSHLIVTLEVFGYWRPVP